MTYETILLDKDPHDAFAVLTLNRPEKLNAIDKTVIREIVHAVKACSAEVVALPARSTPRLCWVFMLLFSASAMRPSWFCMLVRSSLMKVMRPPSRPPGVRT